MESYEIFLTDDHDANPFDVIVEKCTVLPWSEYEKKYREEIAKDKPPQDIYYVKSPQ